MGEHCTPAEIDDSDSVSYTHLAPIPSIRQNKKHNKSALVGGLSNGSYGMSAMQIDRDGLKANKAWLFTDRYAVCIGSEIKSDSALTVTTSIDQRLKCDNLEMLNRDGWHLINSKQHFNSEELRFFPVSYTHLDVYKRQERNCIV